MAQYTFLAVDAFLAEHTLLNTYASVGHDSSLGRSCVLSPGAVINGNVRLADQVLIGSNAVVTPGRQIHSKARLAAGSVTYRDIPAEALAIGNPAKSKLMPR